MAGFDDVDREAHPEWFVTVLDQQHAQIFKQQYKRRVLELLEVRPGMAMLEAGCGAGQDARDLAAIVGPGGHVTGLDYSQTMVEEARRRYGAHGLPLDFVQGDLHALVFADASFDRCRADRTFMHLADPRRALGELARVLKPGGRLLIVEPDHETRVIDTPYKDVTRRAKGGSSAP
jgi:ubiquinone/menaquinone biosynthesis C-methylase UbiE